jgi:hypothetical protein
LFITRESNFAQASEIDDQAVREIVRTGNAGVATTANGELAFILLRDLDDRGDLGRVGRSEEARRLNLLNLAGPVGIGCGIGIGSAGRENGPKLRALSE